MQSSQQPSIISNEDLKKTWNKFSSIYSLFDSTMHTFYYSLVNMLKIGQANHILEIASGIGKMIPYTLSLKKKQSTYLASDISQNMIEMSKKYLEDYLRKIGVNNTVEQWMEKNNLTYRVLDGEKPFESAYKFDRIICNLVLMITEDPKRMLVNLASVAQEGCLLGVTIWGDKNQSNFMTLPTAAMKEFGLPIPNIRQNFHLYNQLEPLANESGWEVIVQWDQNAPFKSFDIDEDLKAFISDRAKGDSKMEQYITKKVNEIFAKKQVLNFPTQMAILRKK